MLRSVLGHAKCNSKSVDVQVGQWEVMFTLPRSYWPCHRALRTGLFIIYTREDAYFIYTYITLYVYGVGPVAMCVYSWRAQRLCKITLLSVPCTFVVTKVYLAGVILLFRVIIISVVRYCKVCCLVNKYFEP